MWTRTDRFMTYRANAIDRAEREIGSNERSSCGRWWTPLARDIGIPAKPVM